MPRSILITGAGGFIGKHLVAALLSHGYAPADLRIVLWHDEVADTALQKDIEVLRGDICDPAFVSLAMKGVKTVYHLAARTDFRGTTLQD